METLDRSQLGGTDVLSGAGLVASLLSISKAVRALMHLRLTDLGLYPGQDEMLLVLSDEAPLPVGQIAERLNVRVPTVSKMKERMVQQRLISEFSKATDARNTWVQLTPDGRVMATRVQSLHRAIDRELLMSAQDEADELNRAAGQIEELLTLRLRRLR